MPTANNTNNANNNVNNLLINPRELYRSGARGQSNGGNGFSEALQAFGPALESTAGLVSGKSVVSAALSTGLQSLGGGGGAIGLNTTGRLRPPPTLPNQTSGAVGSDSYPPGVGMGDGDYAGQMGDFQNSQMKMFMLMEKTQQMSTYWQTITNISKTKHETAMNAVRNLKS